MLCESFANWRQYDFGSVWCEIMTWLEKQTADSLSEDTTIAGCHVGVSRYETKRLDSCLFETHRRMVDVQYVLQGEEWLYVTPSNNLPLLDPFDEQRDVGFHIMPQRELGRITLAAGHFALLMPWDAHMPMVAVNNVPAPVHKAVVKIPVDLLHLKTSR